jgi:undecaprenyl diphosphate synthase
MNLEIFEKYTIDPERIPKHVAVIMDGNGRWAKERGMNRVNGHNEGVNSARDIIEGSVDLGVKYLTLYVFSKENWNRPEFEVNCLMSLLVSTISNEITSLMEKNVRVIPIGEIGQLPELAAKSLNGVVSETSKNTGMTLMLAISYSGREEIIRAVNRIIEEGRHSITEQDFRKYLYVKDAPDPELLIRTGGEFRISNFLLWQCAYTEIYISNKFWPEFRKEDYIKAVLDYQSRERRFGKTSEQIKGGSH